MNGSIVRTVTSDGVELQGLYFKPSGVGSAPVVLHLHGIFGNFYGNPFIDYFADFYPRHGYAFLTGNTRDHDEASMYGHFEDCMMDIPAWLSLATQQGHYQAILQGHSLGALKAVYYLMNAGVPAMSIDIRRLILLSPFDNIAFYSSGSEERRRDNLGKVRDIAAKDPALPIPKEVWDMWPLSARTYLELNEDGGKADVFPFRKGTLRGSALDQVSVPVFAAIGGADFASLPSPQGNVEQLSRLRQVHAALIENAPHNFAQHEPELLREILAWA